MEKVEMKTTTTKNDAHKQNKQNHYDLGFYFRISTTKFNFLLMLLLILYLSKMIKQILENSFVCTFLFTKSN
jgi:hypothetical protein